MDRVVRSNRRAPTWSSSSLTSMLMPEGDRCTCSAALAKLCRRVTSRKAWSWRVLTFISFDEEFIRIFRLINVKSVVVIDPQRPFND